jgi:hypothetical protein
MTPFEISKKDIMNMGILLNTEFRRTNLPHKTGVYLSNKRVFVQIFLLPYATYNLVVVLQWELIFPVCTN